MALFGRRAGDQPPSAAGPKPAFTPPKKAAKKARKGKSKPKAAKGMRGASSDFSKVFE